MPCSRCNGLMISERYLGLDGQLRVSRCANCGAIVDAKIEHHQRARDRMESQRRRARHRFPQLSRWTYSRLLNE